MSQDGARVLKQDARNGGCVVGERSRAQMRPPRWRKSGGHRSPVKQNLEVTICIGQDVFTSLPDTNNFVLLKPIFYR